MITSYFTETGENDWHEDESYAWHADGPWDMTWESAEASGYPGTAWYGEASRYRRQHGTVKTVPGMKDPAKIGMRK